MIVIVDYNMGNPLSIKNMLKKAGFESHISADTSIIKQASKLILPGVGAFGTAMKNIDALGLMDVLNDSALRDRKPILGICLGMQLMCEQSEEGNIRGLGWIKAEVKRFPKTIDGEKLRIPHIGWTLVNGRSELLNPLYKSRFYFVHSYYVEIQNKEDVLFTSSYGLSFCSGFQKNNIIGVQFHPEKSHKFGMYLLKSFASQ